MILYVKSRDFNVAQSKSELVSGLGVKKNFVLLSTAPIIFAFTPVDLMINVVTDEDKRSTFAFFQSTNGFHNQTVSAHNRTVDYWIIAYDFVVVAIKMLSGFV
jgi:hypothetical protein